MESELEYNGKKRRIARNAFLLYFRMFLSMVVGLYTSRVVLRTLGVEDYGIYGVVGGVVSMMGFLNASMSGATSRFLTFELGRGDKKRLSDTFSSALIAHILVAIIVFLLAETIGLWFLNNKLVIPENRMLAAHWVYQCSILSAMLGITQAPYNASIIAHEKMGVYAYVEILNVTLKLLIVYLLFIGNFDKLKLYSVLVLAVSILIMLIYRIYCVRKFKETHFHWIWKKDILKPLLSFSGWDLYGNMAWSIRQQGANFILNIFYGPIINAASSISSTVQGVLMGFSTNVITAFKPAIIKDYSNNKYDEMNTFMIFASKISTIFLLIISLPLMLRTDFILRLWLGEYPKEAIFMTKASLIMNIATCYSLIVLTGIHASGKVKETAIFSGSVYILCLPIMYYILNFNYTYVECYWLFIIVAIIITLINLFILKHHIPRFQLSLFILKSMIPVFFISLCSYFFVSYISNIFIKEDTLLNFIILSILSTIIIIFNSLFMASNRHERKNLCNLLRNSILNFIKNTFK